MRRPFKPRIGLVVEDLDIEKIEIPDLIKTYFDVRIALSTSFDDFSDYIFDSEILITVPGIYEPKPYQIHFQIFNSTELEQEIIWEYIYEAWYGINEQKDTKSDEYTELKKGISVLINNGHVIKARKIIELLTDVVENDEEWLSYLAMTLYLENDIEQAIRILRQCYLLNPSSTDILYNLGFMYKVNGEIRTSIYYFERLLQVTTNTVIIAEVSEMLAECYYYT
ncbi:hypothetical protein SAMN05720606_11589 [Paenibacillus polysaccharolyticus]|uniref:Uncharacterized protein n=1 Tax=Paenibacillus polysaccharolyticus TaxID=582692 RepID=A0A1G5KIM9_9BACL|nr:hypothetical protein [Paenibacillus polysaccharolyticus]SCZ00437.1 hypothetical protein SAMN05720606_11589 [Paenibacillus polysaccharolyticus]